MFFKKLYTYRKDNTLSFEIEREYPLYIYMIYIHMQYTCTSEGNEPTT